MPGFIVGELDDVAGCAGGWRKKPRVGHATEL
jgi:hypothetical protein